MEELSDYLSSAGLSFLHYILPVSFSNISKNASCSLNDLFHIYFLSYLGNMYLPSSLFYCVFCWLNLSGKAKKKRKRNWKFSLQVEASVPCTSQISCSPVFFPLSYLSCPGGKMQTFTSMSWVFGALNAQRSWDHRNGCAGICAFSNLYTMFGQWKYKLTD